MEREGRKEERKKSRKRLYENERYETTDTVATGERERNICLAKRKKRKKRVDAMNTKIRNLD